MRGKKITTLTGRAVELPAKRLAEMTVARKAYRKGQTRQVALTAGQPLKGFAKAKPREVLVQR